MTRPDWVGRTLGRATHRPRAIADVPDTPLHLMGQRRAPVELTRDQRRTRLTHEGVQDLWCAEFDSPHTSWPIPLDVRADSREEATAHFQAMSDQRDSVVHGLPFRIIGMVPKEDYKS